MQRILIKNDQGKRFRICSFEFNDDHKREGYVKFSFPDLEKVKASVPEDDFLMEFSVHLPAGVSHFKKADQSRVHRNISPSTIVNSEMIHLMTYTLYDLNHFKEFTKKVTPDDYQVNNIFDSSKGKVFEFYLSPLTDEVIIPAKKYEDLTWRLYHPFVSTVKNYRMLMVEYDFNDLDRTKNGVDLYRSYDQKVEHISVKIPESML